MKQIRAFTGTPADIRTRQGLQQAGAKLLTSYAPLPAAMKRLPNPTPFVRLVPEREPWSTKTRVIFLTEGQERPPLYERDLTPFWQLDTWATNQPRARASAFKGRKARAA